MQKKISLQRINIWKLEKTITKRTSLVDRHLILKFHYFGLSIWGLEGVRIILRITFDDRNKVNRTFLFSPEHTILLLFSL
jgi:hypothetical protein